MLYLQCCEPFHQGLQDKSVLPKTAQQLIRSRYSAYVLKLENYLLFTWHVSTRPAELALMGEENIKWLGLQVKSIEAGLAGDSNGKVKFVARYKKNGTATRIHEISRFIKEQDQWFYVDGEIE